MVYFISDMHLGARYIPDARAHEMRVVRWLNSIAADATELYILGDALDFWFEYRSVVPRGFVRFFGALASLADSGVKIHWMRGNHDMWIFDYLPSEIGMEMMNGPVTREILGKRFLLDHGDAVGHRPASFRLLRRIFRNGMCRRAYAAIHPRWTMAIAHGWSSSSRKGHMSGPVAEYIGNPEDEALVRYAREYLADPSNPHVDYFIFGHRHALLRHILRDDSTVAILGDWITGGSFASWDGSNFTLSQIFPPK